ncbi:MAG TPA: glycosyltransferase family 2 protein [Candidatus Polarisedimenticolia bacterium]|nr:glycosyltransferase family 2 protein [Candidatus Polarisedimenticolia bacterium]
MTTNRIDLDDVPVIIVSRDRVACLRELVGWLEGVGLRNIIIVDMQSSYGPLVEYLRNTPHRVVRLSENIGPWAIWSNREFLAATEGRYYVVTDPDVVPAPGCPADAIGRFHELLQKYPAYAKAGFGLRIDDIPDCYKHKTAVLNWEKQFWTREIEPGVYDAPLDTTFALYRPSTSFALRALRTGPPYVARHLPWYQDLDALPEDEHYYMRHADTSGKAWHRELTAEMQVYMIANPVRRFMKRRMLGIKRSLAKRVNRVRMPNMFGA